MSREMMRNSIFALLNAILCGLLGHVIALTTCQILGAYKNFQMTPNSVVVPVVVLALLAVLVSKSKRPIVVSAIVATSAFTAVFIFSLLISSGHFNIWQQVRQDLYFFLTIFVACTLFALLDKVYKNTLPE